MTTRVGCLDSSDGGLCCYRRVTTDPITVAGETYTDKDRRRRTGERVGLFCDHDLVLLSYYYYYSYYYYFYYHRHKQEQVKKSPLPSAIQLTV